MKQDNKKTKVLFLIELDSENDVFAFFPENKENEDGWSCYSHIGQHSTCGYIYANDCSKATPEQYKDLKQELESIGYNLDVLNENEQALEDIYFSDLKNW